MTWPQIVFGWPTILLAIGLFTAGFMRERTKLGFLGVVAAMPFLWYASHSPGGLWLSPLLLLALGAAAELLRRGLRWPAAVCVAPFAFIVLTVAAAVASQR